MKYDRPNEKSIYAIAREYEEDQKEEIIELLTTQKYDEALDKAQDYVNQKKDQVVVLKKKDTGEHLFLEYSTRFSPSYRLKLIKKFRSLLSSVRCKIGHFTLTFENCYFSDLLLQKKNISKSLNEFCQYLARYLHKREKIKYVATKEITISNQKLHLHIHLIVFDLQYVSKLELNDLKNAWRRICQKNALKGEYIFYAYRKDSTALQYALKYVLKEFLDLNITSLILHFLKLRSYTTSEKIHQDQTEKPEARYEYIGIYTKEQARIHFRYEDPSYTPPKDDFQPQKVPTFYIMRNL